MNNEILKHEEFGDIRMEMRGGEPWFVGKDLCDALGYKNSVDALKKHLLPKHISQVVIHGTRSKGGATQSRQMTIINESGMYRLILRSKMPDADRFTDWVTSEVLPAIRKTGGYVKRAVRLPRLVSYEGYLCISYGWLVSAGVYNDDTLKAHVARGKVKKVRIGGNGREALLVYDTLPEKYRQKLEAMYGLPAVEGLPAAGYRFTSDEMLGLVSFITTHGVTKQAIVHRLLSGEEAKKLN